MIGPFSYIKYFLNNYSDTLNKPSKPRQELWLPRTLGFTLPHREASLERLNMGDAYTRSGVFFIGLCTPETQMQPERLWPRKKSSTSLRMSFLVSFQHGSNKTILTTANQLGVPFWRVPIRKGEKKIKTFSPLIQTFHPSYM